MLLLWLQMTRFAGTGGDTYSLLLTQPLLVWVTPHQSCLARWEGR